MIETTDATFQRDVMASPVPVLVDFWAEWCQPCKAMLPHLEKLAKEYGDRLRVAKHDCQSGPGVPQQYGILMLPTLYLVMGGRVVDAISGTTTPVKVRAMLAKHGVTA